MDISSHEILYSWDWKYYDFQYKRDTEFSSKKGESKLTDCQFFDETT